MVSVGSSDEDGGGYDDDDDDGDVSLEDEEEYGISAGHLRTLMSEDARRTTRSGRAKLEEVEVEEVSSDDEEVEEEGSDQGGISTP